MTRVYVYTCIEVLRSLQAVLCPGRGVETLPQPTAVILVKLMSPIEPGRWHVPLPVEWDKPNNRDNGKWLVMYMHTQLP